MSPLPLFEKMSLCKVVADLGIIKQTQTNQHQSTKQGTHYCHNTVEQQKNLFDLD